MMIGLLRVSLLLSVFVSAFCTAQTLEILNEENYPPFSSNQSGLSLEIVDAAFSAVDIEPQFVPVPFARLTKMIKSDLAIAGFNIIKEEYAEDDFIFPKTPIYTVSTQYYFHKERASHKTSNKGLDDIELLVGEVIGFMYSKAHFDRPFQRYKANTEEQLLQMLLAKRLDAAYITKEVVCHLGLKESRYLTELGTENQEGRHSVDMYIAFNKNFPQAQQLADAFDKGMQIIKNSGKYQAIASMYLGKGCL